MSDKLKSEMIAELSKIIDSIDDAFMNHTVAPHLVGYMIAVKVQASIEIQLWEGTNEQTDYYYSMVRSPSQL